MALRSNSFCFASFKHCDELISWISGEFPFVGVSAWITSLALWSNSFCLASFKHCDELASWTGVQTNFPFVGVSARITSSALRSNSSYIVTNWPVGVQAKFPFVGVSAWITSLVLRSNSFCFAGFPHFDELAGWHPGDSSLYRRFGQDYHFGAEVQ